MTAIFCIISTSPVPLLAVFPAKMDNRKKIDMEYCTSCETQLHTSNFSFAIEKQYKMGRTMDRGGHRNDTGEIQ